MWLRNYKNLIQTWISCSNYGITGGSPHNFGDSYAFNFKSTGGTVYEIQIKEATSVHASIFASFASLDISSKFFSYVNVAKSEDDVPSGSGYYITLGLGSSSTEPTEDDYKLGAIITGYTKQTGSVEVELNDDGTLTLKTTLIIKASEDILISEMGLYLPYRRRSSTTSNTGAAVSTLVYREVLDQPISILNGQIAELSFSITTPKISIA